MKLTGWKARRLKKKKRKKEKEKEKIKMIVDFTQKSWHL